MKNVYGKTVLITGAAQGFGKAMAQKFGGRGCKLVLVDINEKLLHETAEELRAQGMEVLPIVADLRSRVEAEGIIDKTLEAWGRVDILINNAGCVYARPLPDLTVEEINDMINIDLMATIWSTRRVIPHMVDRGSGHIVNIASLGGRGTPPYISPYAAAKAGVILFTDCIEQELHHTGVKTTVINPSFSKTGMFAGTKRPRFLRWATPEGVAEAAHKAVVREKAEVYVPGTMWLLAFVRVTFMSKLAHLLGRLTGTHRSVDNLVKRKGAGTATNQD